MKIENPNTINLDEKRAPRYSTHMCALSVNHLVSGEYIFFIGLNLSRLKLGRPKYANLE